MNRFLNFTVHEKLGLAWLDFRKMDGRLSSSVNPAVIFLSNFLSSYCTLQRYSKSNDINVTILFSFLSSLLDSEFWLSYVTGRMLLSRKLLRLRLFFFLRRRVLVFNTLDRFLVHLGAFRIR